MSGEMKTKELIAQGYRPIILAMVAEGLDTRAISKAFDEEYGIKVSPTSLGMWLGQTVPDVKSLQTHTMRRELAELHQDALDAVKHFRDGMREAETLPDEVPGPKGGMVPNAYRLDLMKFYQTAWRDWWDRVSKIHGVGTPTSQTTNFIAGGDQTISPVKVIMEEMQKGTVDADTLDNILDRLGEGE